MQLFLILLHCFLVAAAAAATRGLYNSPRLPTALQPRHYNLSVFTPQNSNFFTGTVEILLDAEETTRQIVLHANNLNIFETSLEEFTTQKPLHIISTENNPKFHYFIIQTGESLFKDNQYLLSLKFSGKLNNVAEGYYSDSVENSWYTVTQFERNGARQAFPCFDEPALRATFDISLGHHKNFTSLSNMHLAGTRPNTQIPDYIWSTFETTPSMSTYLVAYSINDFAYLKSQTKGSNPIEFSTWAHPAKINEAQYSAEIAPKMLEYFEELFDQRYPLKKVDQLAVDRFHYSGMENWGLIVYKDNAILTSSSSNMGAAALIAHELAHFWWGDMVTINWWGDLWLKEGFATYFSVVAVDAMYPDLHHAQNQHMVNQESACRHELEQDLPAMSHSVIVDFQENQQKNSVISYRKASSVIHMMHHMLGDAAFYAGLRSYLKEFAYGSGVPNQLWTHLQAASDKMNALPHGYKVKTIMDTWTLQSGFPSLKVQRNYKSGTVLITQEHFLARQNPEKKGCWWIPITYTTEGEKVFNNTITRAWLKCDKSGQPQALELKMNAKSNEWVFFNLNGVGHYNVEYDEHNYNMIAAASNRPDHGGLNCQSRGQLVNNIFFFNRSLEGLKFLRTDRSFIPWHTLEKNLATLHKRLNKKEAQQLMIDLLMSIYHERSFSKENLDLRPLIQKMACMYGIQNCIDWAFKQLALSKYKTKTIEDNLKPAVVCAVLCHGTEDHKKILQAIYKESLSCLCFGKMVELENSE